MYQVTSLRTCCIVLLHIFSITIILLWVACSVGMFPSRGPDVTPWSSISTVRCTVPVCCEFASMILGKINIPYICSGVRWLSHAVCHVAVPEALRGFKSAAAPENYEFGGL